MATYQAINACTWRNGKYIPSTTDNIRQGVYEPYGECVGVMIFNLTTIRDQYTDYYPTSATLTLTRVAGGSWGSDRTMTLYAGNQTDIPPVSSSTDVVTSRPSKVTSGYNYTVSAGLGEKTFNIATALINSIGSGASNCIFMDGGSSTTNYMSFTGRNDLTEVILTVNWASRTTAAGAPTVCSLSSTLAEGNVTLSWSGATAGTNNAITYYEIQYSESTDNSTWGSWTALTTVTTSATSGSLSVAPPTTRGNFRRFRIRTRGSAGSSYYSAWKVSTNSVRKNTLPSAPSTAVASPEIHSNETITLTWFGAAGGTSAIKGYRISSRTSTDNSTWSSWTELTTLILNASGGSYHPTVSNISGTYTQFGIWTVDALNAYSTEKVSNSIYCNITACTEPSTFALNVTIAEGNLTLSWNGAVAGAGNAITGYEIQYSDSSDNSSWDAWTVLTTLSSSLSDGSLSVSPPSTRGNYRRYQIRTLGNAGSSYYSGWKVSSNTVRKNILPTPPTSLSASPALYETQSVTITWSGAVVGTSPIKQYLLQRSTSSMGNPTWSSYETLAIIVSSETYGNYTAEASQTPGTSTRYRLSVTDTIDAVSSYVVSNTVTKNSPPTAPIISSPVSGRSIYNTTPRFMITTGMEPDGQTQIVEVKIDTGVWHNSVDDSEMFSTSGYLGDSTKTVYQASTLAAGSHTVTFRCLDSALLSPSMEVIRTFNVLTSPFETISANVTHVKAMHILALRTAVNTIRHYYGLETVSWDEEIVAAKTAVREWPYHIMELRAALEPVITMINSFDTSSTFDIPPVTWLPIGTDRPKADVVQQIQNLLLTM
ncbi:hypothetical protein [Anaerocolumna sp. MB42-C2]|uniref:hypothetical protein n=1 Tax=Anaerocolumna sp. MB42-C2 TaxID=3070997 RepID=UPI0027E04838|nr:hypothetical protein [Anaerocolumna sp. MB42-C2]WMJ86771.1 hypothetical protein RBU59_22435 [Anaerocolumna sp. MB42-C2]